MVSIDMQVTFRLDGEIDKAVSSDLFQHVIEKRHAGRQLSQADAIEIEAYGDLGLFGDAFDPCGATGSGGVHDWQSSVQAASNKSFSSGVPTVMRRQLASRGCQPSRFFTSMRRAFSPSKNRVALLTRTTTKFVCVGYTATPGSLASACSSLARCARMSAACSLIQAVSASNACAAACVNAFTLYGCRTL